MYKKIFFILFVIFFTIFNTFSQTIGVLRNDSGSFNGYTLLAPVRSTETYLINNCGQVINQWTSAYTTGASVYLLENGNLLRTAGIENTDITFGGVGGKIELFDWDGNLIWEYTYSSPTFSQHHDIFPLPNGNILMLAVTTMDMNEAIQAGRDPSKLDDGKLYNEQILELEPVGTNQANIIWEWNIKNHLIQDFDASKDNFGVISDNPQLLNINYLLGSSTDANWLHVNSIQYNEELDQIVLSTRHLSEIYIIDHSTTTAQAATTTGGTYGKGGDFLYRWGNKEAYNKGISSERTLYAQHYPHWIPNGLNDAGKIMIFNNGTTSSTSSIDIIDPPTSSPGFYTYDTNGYLPTIAEWQYIDPNDPTNFFSGIMSSGQRLPNGNTLICDGDSGYFFEIDINDNKVWEYINPDTTTEILTQGDTPDPASNIVFRAIRFSTGYAAFTGRDLTPGDPIELNFDIDFCSILSVDDYDLSNKIQLYPNPTNNIITVNSDFEIDNLEVYDLFGKIIISIENSKTINIKDLTSGMYFIKIYSDDKFGTKKILKQ